MHFKLPFRYNISKLKCSKGFGMRDFVFPENMREYTYDKSHVLKQNFLLRKKSFLRLALVTAVGFPLFLGWMGGLEMLLQMRAILLMASLLGGYWLIVLLFFFWRCRQMINNDKGMYMPQAFGFDAKALYSATPLSQSRTEWELFSALEELSDAFVLRTSRSGYIIPKAIWSGEEQTAIRECLKARVRPTSLWLKARRDEKREIASI